MRIGYRASFITQQRRFGALIQSVTVRVTTYPGIRFIGIDSVPASIIRGRGTVRVNHRSVTDGPRTVHRGVIRNQVRGHLGRLTLVSRPFVGSRGVSVRRVIGRTISRLNRGVRIHHFIHFILNRNVRGRRASFTTRITTRTNLGGRRPTPTTRTPTRTGPTRTGGRATTTGGGGGG